MGIDLYDILGGLAAGGQVFVDKKHADQKAALAKKLEEEKRANAIADEEHMLKFRETLANDRAGPPVTALNKDGTYTTRAVNGRGDIAYEHPAREEEIKSFKDAQADSDFKRQALQETLLDRQDRREERAYNVSQRGAKEAEQAQRAADAHLNAESYRDKNNPDKPLPTTGDVVKALIDDTKDLRAQYVGDGKTNKGMITPAEYERITTAVVTHVNAAPQGKRKDYRATLAAALTAYVTKRVNTNFTEHTAGTPIVPNKLGY